MDVEVSNSVKVATRLSCNGLQWDRLDEMFNNNEPHGFVLLCQNHGTMIAIYDYTYCLCVCVQISSWTLEYRVQ